MNIFMSSCPVICDKLFFTSQSIWPENYGDCSLNRDADRNQMTQMILSQLIEDFRIRKFSAWQSIAQ